MPASGWGSLWESSSFVPWFSTFVFRNVPGTVLECVCICWFERNSSNLDRASEMRDSILLNYWDSFLVILPSISSETCVIYSSLILGTDVFRDWPFLGCSSTYSVSLNFRERLRARYVNTLVGSVTCALREHTCRERLRARYVEHTCRERLSARYVEQTCSCVSLVTAANFRLFLNAAIFEGKMPRSYEDWISFYLLVKLSL